MNNRLIRQIRKNMKSKTTEELTQILKKSDKKQYSEEAFEAIRQILEAREENISNKSSMKNDFDIQDRVEEKETFMYLNCGRFISEYDFMSHDGLCKYCRGMPMQKGFPSPPGFPKL